MWELWGVEISPLPLKRHIAYTTACCYRTSRDTVQHAKGADNSTADALSRLELPPSTDTDTDEHLEDGIMQVEKTRVLWVISILPVDENNTAQLQPVISDGECIVEQQQNFAAERIFTATQLAATTDNAHAAKQPVSFTAAVANARPHEQRPTEGAVLAVSVQTGTQQGGQLDRETHTPVSIRANIQPLQGSTAEIIQTDDITEVDHTQENTLQLAQTYDIARLQSECNDFKFIMDYLSTGNLPQTNDAAARKIIFEAERYVLLEGVLYHIQLPRTRRQADLQLSMYQLAVPAVLRHIVLSHYHEGICHPAAEKMYLTIRTKFYWPGLFTDTYEWAKTCPACQKGKDYLHLRDPLKPLPVEGLFKRWSIDHLCPPRSGEYNFVLLAVDSFTLFSVLMPAKSTTAEETAQLLFDNIFCVFSSQSILSVRGTCFRSKLMAELCRLLNVKRIYTASYHPKTSARAEAFNKVILNSIRTATEGYKEWPQLLPVIGHAHRTSIIKHLGISPFQICFRIQPNLPVDCTLQPNLANLPTSVKTYFQAMELQLKLMRETVR